MRHLYLGGDTFRSLLVARYFLLVAGQEILKDFFSKSKQKVLHINLYKKFNL